MSTDTTRKLTRIFERVLEVGGVGDQDDFFILGGNSLTAISLLDEIASEFAVHVPVGQFYRATRVTELAEAIDAIPPDLRKDLP